MDDSHPNKFQASFDRLPKEMQDEVMATRNVIVSAHHAAAVSYHPAPERQQSKATISPAMKEFADRLAAKGTDPSEAPAGDEG